MPTSFALVVDASSTSVSILRKAACSGGVSLLQILAVNQRDVDGLPDQIEQILPRKFHESRAQEDVIMDVVDA